MINEEYTSKNVKDVLMDLVNDIDKEVKLYEGEFTLDNVYSCEYELLRACKNLLDKNYVQTRELEDGDLRKERKILNYREEVEAAYKDFRETIYDFENHLLFNKGKDDDLATSTNDFQRALLTTYLNLAVLNNSFNVFKDLTYSVCVPTLYRHWEEKVRTYKIDRRYELLDKYLQKMCEYIEPYLEYVFPSFKGKIKNIGVVGTNETVWRDIVVRVKEEHENVNYAIAIICPTYVQLGVLSTQDCYENIIKYRNVFTRYGKFEYDIFKDKHEDFINGLTQILLTVENKLKNYGKE